MPHRPAALLLVRMCVVVVLVAALSPAVASAQISSARTGVAFYTENDDWWPDTGTDKNYTNGFRLMVEKNLDIFGVRRWKLFKWVPEHKPCSTTEDEKELCVS